MSKTNRTGGSSRKKKELKGMLGVLSSFCAFWVIHSGLGSGLLNIFEKSKRRITEKELIRKSGYAGRFVSSWLRAAYSFGIVDYHSQNKIYGLTSYLENILLDPSDRSYLGASFRMFAELTDIFKRHPEVMRSGGKMPLASQTIPLLTAMADVTKADFCNLWDRAIRTDIKFHDRLTRGGTILDIGTGLGYGLIHLAKVYRECRLTGVDIDERVLAKAKSEIRKENLEKRIELKALNAKGMHAKNKFDLICMNLSLHEVGANNRERLDVLKKYRRLLKNGGKMIISELAVPDRVTDCRQPFLKLLMGVQMCEAVFGGEVLTSGMLRSLIFKAGFKKIQAVNQPDSSRVLFLVQK